MSDQQNALTADEREWLEQYLEAPETTAAPLEAIRKLAAAKQAPAHSDAAGEVLSILRNARGRMAQYGRKYVRLDLAEINDLIDVLATNTFEVES